MDGIYIIRSSVPSPPLSAEELVKTYKELSVVERAFRCMKTVDLNVRPIHHRLSNRVRAHIFLCMLSYYVEWHMRKSLAPILFEDDQPEEGEALRESIVAPSQRSPEAIRKAQTKRTADDKPVHSFNTLLKDLATICKQKCQPNHPEMPSFEKTTIPTPLSYALPLTYGTDVLHGAVHGEHVMPFSIDLAILSAFCAGLFAVSLWNIRRRWIA